MDKTLRGILEELVEQSVTEGINWSKNSSTPIRGVNIDADLSLPIDQAISEIQELVPEERPELAVMRNKMTCSQCGQKYHSEDIGHNSAIKLMKERMGK